MIRRPSRALLIYLGVLSIAGALALYLATARMGPGVSTDSASIMSTAENLVRGNGLLDYSGRELTQFPPLYSVILAFGAWIFGADVFIVGWVLNILVFAAIVLCSGLLLNEAFSEEPIVAYLGSFVVASSASLIQISANIASDPPFMLLVLIFLMLASAYLRTGERRYAVVAALLVIVTCFLRYAGLALVITGGLIALYAQRKDMRGALACAGLFMLIAGGPIFAWGYLHNRPYNGTVFGGRLPADAAINFQTGIEKLQYWFLPHSVISAMGELPLFALILAACVLVIVLTGAANFAEKLKRPQIVPHIAFLAVYSAVLIFNISTTELKGLETDRVHIVALPSVLVIVSALLTQVLARLQVRLGRRPVYAATAALFLLWSLYPISKAHEYVSQSMVHGDVSPYNSINKGDIQTSALATYLRGLDLNGKRVYSNGVDTTWFMLRSTVKRSPTLNTQDRLTELRENYEQWPLNASGGYMVWINAEAHKTFYATPKELATIAQLTQVYRDENGVVYLVQASQ